MVTADARIKLVRAGLDPEAINDDGTMDIDFSKLATEYWVRVVPGSLVEMEDEKQLRILNQLFVPLSQAMPALAAVQDQQMLRGAAKAMQYIIGKQIELSGASSAKDIGLIWEGRDSEAMDNESRVDRMEDNFNSIQQDLGDVLQMNENALRQLQEQIGMLRESQEMVLKHLGAEPV
jgi:hypothetical protein